MGAGKGLAGCGQGSLECGQFAWWGFDMAERDRWIRHIKELRGAYDVSIDDAEKLALTDASWRRWVERQINSDERCRHMALRHIRYNGDEALIRKSRDRLEVC
jgi:hypothetical protein